MNRRNVQSQKRVNRAPVRGGNWNRIEFAEWEPAFPIVDLAQPLSKYFEGDSVISEWKNCGVNWLRQT